MSDSVDDPADGSRPARSNVIAIFGLVAAILATPFAYIPLAFPITIALALLAIALGVIGRRRASRLRGRGRTLAGIACGVGTFALAVGVLSALATWNATRIGQ